MLRRHALYLLTRSSQSILETGQLRSLAWEVFSQTDLWGYSVSAPGRFIQVFFSHPTRISKQATKYQIIAKYWSHSGPKIL